MGLHPAFYYGCIAGASLLLLAAVLKVLASRSDRVRCEAPTFESRLMMMVELVLASALLAFLFPLTCILAVLTLTRLAADPAPFAADRWRFSLMMAAPLAGGLLFNAYMLRELRLHYQQWRRAKLGVCHRCGYDLTGNVSGICPECGTPTRG